MCQLCDSSQCGPSLIVLDEDVAVLPADSTVPSALSTMTGMGDGVGVVVGVVRTVDGNGVTVGVTVMKVGMVVGIGCAA